MKQLPGRVMYFLAIPSMVTVALAIVMPQPAMAADVEVGRLSYLQNCSSCHGGSPVGLTRAASVRQLQLFATDPSPHPGGSEPVRGASLPDLAAYISSQVEPGYSIQGTVADLSGAMEAGQRVLLRSDYLSVPAPGETVTDGSGAFRFDTLPPGDFRLEVVAPAYWVFPERPEVTAYPGLVPDDGLEFTAVSTNNPGGTNVAFTSAAQHVSLAGDDARSGRSWHLAKRTIAAAISAAPNGGEIWVAEGVYHELLALYGRQLYGGFAGTEVDRSQRDWRVHAAVLDGDAAALEPLGLFPGTMVLMGDAATNRACLDGLTIMNGAANSTGGGVYVEPYSSPVIAHCRFLTNSAALGGGIYCGHDSLPAIVGNDFEQNYAWLGGALYLDSHCTPQMLANNLVVNNRSDDGAAGLYSNGDQVTVANNTFVGNEVIFGGAGAVGFNAGSAVVRNNIMAFNTGGIAIEGPASVVESSNCIFANADADFSGMSADVSDVLQDPACRDVAGQDFHLRPTSPCVDAGDDSAIPMPVDFEGHPRAARRHVDIGAYELPPPSLTLEKAVGQAGLRVTWPMEEASFVLETCTNLDATSWQPVADAPLTDGARRSVAINVSSPAGFYRLHQTAQ